MELGWPDALHLSTSRLHSQFGRLHALPSHGRCPLPVLVFQAALAVPGSWPSLCVEICASSDISLPGSFGISYGSSPSHVRSWFRSCVSPRLDQSLRDRLCTAVYSLFVFHVDLCSQSVNGGPNGAVCERSSLPSHARFWGLCRWGHDPFPGGRAARHLGSSLSCVFCSAPLGDLANCLSECPAFADLRAEWCNQVSVPSDSVAFWARHSWIFNPRCSLNSMTHIFAHVSFVGQVCERFVALLVGPVLPFLACWSSNLPVWAPQFCCGSGVSLPRQLCLRGSRFFLALSARFLQPVRRSLCAPLV